MKYAKNKKVLFPGVKSLIIGLILLVVGFLIVFASICIQKNNLLYENKLFNRIISVLALAGLIIAAVGFVVGFVGVLIINRNISNRNKLLQFYIRRGFFDYRLGNPLNFKDGELLPKIRCRECGDGRYKLSIEALPQNTVKDIEKLSQAISASLKGRFKRYGVVSAESDLALNEVVFILEDVMIDRTIIAESISELKPRFVSKLMLQIGDFLDLQFAGSILCAGKTRSGKTTAIMILLMQVLLLGRDKHGSMIVIIDPKQAELSRLSHVETLDKDGLARTILDRIKQFADSVVERQSYLNELSEKKGDAVKWFDPEAGMKPSYLFIDEYVCLYEMFPKKASKEDPDYCLETFEALIKRITTMGASAGCFIIISVAEASVGSGNISTLIKSALTTKMLFKPTRVEASFLWETRQLEALPERTYRAGECFFSSPDGEHDNPCYIRFPRLEFPAYRALGQLLKEYYRE